MGRRPQNPLYVLPHGIQVLAEYPARGSNRYARLRIRPHRFFDAKEVGGGITVRKSRVLMSSALGRKILATEHVHHKNEDCTDDRLDNLEVISAAEHNSHHKTGSSHTREAKEKISAGLKRAVEEGRKMPPTNHRYRDNLGRFI